MEPPLPISPQPVEHDLVHHGIPADGCQIDGGFSHVEWIDLLAPENLVRRCIDQLIGHAAWTDCADFNVIWPAFISQRFRQGHDPVLGRTIGADTRPGLQARDTRYVDDDPSALLLHVFEAGTATKERA